MNNKTAVEIVSSWLTGNKRIALYDHAVIYTLPVNEA